MKYLKLFETSAQYESWRSSADFVLPNVSYCKDNNLYYNPFVEPASSYIAVDLDLPSGLLWADHNVGAASPEEAGLYFQWGDTVGYTADQVGKDKVFDWSNYWDSVNGSNYNFNKYANNKLTVLQLEDDAARANIGSDWRMPTKADIQELMDNTTFTFIDLQGNEFSKAEAENGAIADGNLKGVRSTGSNGKSIFIPASGECGESIFTYSGSSCALLSSELSSSHQNARGFMIMNNGLFGISSSMRSHGIPVRAVC